MHRLPIKCDDRDPSDEGLGDSPGAALVRRERQCLMCHGQFSSEWSGERICPRCRGGTAWRQGRAVRDTPALTGRAPPLGRSHAM